MFFGCSSVAQSWRADGINALKVRQHSWVNICVPHFFHDRRHIAMCRDVLPTNVTHHQGRVKIKMQEACRHQAWGGGNQFWVGRLVRMPCWRGDKLMVPYRAISLLRRQAKGETCRKARLVQTLRKLDLKTKIGTRQNSTAEEKVCKRESLPKGVARATWTRLGRLSRAHWSRCAHVRRVVLALAFTIAENQGKVIWCRPCFRQNQAPKGLMFSQSNTSGGYPCDKRSLGR
jgi:hypothetical protein